MQSSKKLIATCALGGLLAATGSASALITCNSNGDCWRTETRVTFPDVTLSYHDDPWLDQHRADRTYVWHETDADHDWHHGYWLRGEWHVVKTD